MVSHPIIDTQHDNRRSTPGNDQLHKAHNELDTINSIGSGAHRAHQIAITTTVTHVVSRVCSNALIYLGPALLKVPINEQTMLKTNRPAPDTSPIENEGISQLDTKST